MADKTINGMTTQEYQAHQTRFKGLFPYDATYRYGANQWSSPTPNGDSMYYGGRVDYAVEAGDLLHNSAVVACLMYICTTFPEARFRVMRKVKGGKPVEVEDHPLTKLFNNPNPYYPGQLLLHPSLISYNWRGESYWRKIRNGSGQVIQLYYEPHWTCRPIRANAKEFISYYQLHRDSHWEDVDTEDIVHLRQGMDPEDNMHGFNLMASLLREVFTDNAAARYASSVMSNMGVLGAIVTPKEEGVTIEDPQKLKAMLQAISTGDERGKYGVFSEPLDFHWPDNDPAKMDTRANRRIIEERVSAVLRVPAIVAGLGAGLDRATYANMGEAREMAYEGNIIPTQKLWAAQLNTQLLPDLGNPETEFIDWDYSEVRVLQDDQDKKVTRLNSRLVSGGISLNDYLGELSGVKLPDADNVWYIPKGVTVVQNPLDVMSLPAPTPFGAPPPPPSTDEPTPAEPEAPKAAANGNGHRLPSMMDLYTKAKKPTVDSVTNGMIDELRAEVLRAYDEVADKV